MTNELKAPWLVAVWPGMGGIAQIAGSALIHQLEAQQIATVSAESYFDVRSVKIRSGLIQPRALPRNLVFRWKNPDDGQDLVIFIGDEQPATGGYRFCHELLDVAVDLGVTRVFTFAAMGTPIRPEAEPRVFAGANRSSLLEEVRRTEVELLGDAEITGLNGVLLAATSDRELEGICLLGEFPFFASAFANPKASAAILRRFVALAGIRFDFTQLDAQAAEVERILADRLTQLESTAAQLASSAAGQRATEQRSTRPRAESVDREAKARVEAMFKEAKADRSKALELKAELDRLGLFDAFEDRFLDLFKQAE